MDNKVLELLKETQAVLHGHFLLSSGKHSDGYVQSAKLLQYPDKARQAVEVIVEKLKAAQVDVDVVVGPAMGGIIIAYEVGRQLNVPAIFTERENDAMVLRRGFEVFPHQKVLVVEDVVTTGKSSLETIEVLKRSNATIVGIASLVDRSLGHEIEYPIYSAIQLQINTYEASQCPMCHQNLPIEKPGSRKKF